ncbi:MAG TPA: molybdate ABC transporter substrate-binding protein [Woeseiaceae bacterium]
MPRLRTQFLAILSFALTACFAAPDGADPTRQPVLVAAASDLRFALSEVAALYQADHGIETELTFGSSGNLARQIAQGAPFELFLSADESYVQRLADLGMTRDKGSLYAVGRIVLFAPNGSPLEPDPELKNVADRLADGTLRRFAIANPEHAPYGRVAQQALRSTALWESVQPTLLYGENISQAAQFAASGNAEGGIIAYSLAIAPQFQGQGSYALIPDTLHAPLRQRMVLTRAATAEAEDLYDYLRSPSAREILARYGFAPPND